MVLESKVDSEYTEVSIFVPQVSVYEEETQHLVKGKYETWIWRVFKNEQGKEIGRTYLRTK